MDLLSKARTADQIRIDKLSSDNEAMQNQLKALGVKPAVSGGEPAPTPPSPPPGPEGEPQPASYPPQTGAAVPPPTAFYPGNGMTPPPQVSYQSVPVPNQIQRKTFSYDKGKNEVIAVHSVGELCKKYAYRGGRCQRVCYRE